MEQQKRLLIIEDEASICDILSYKLEKEGYLIKCALNGKIGLETLEKFKPEVVLLDLMLPDMSGFDICKIITVKYKIPVIMLTARNDIVDKVLGLEIGADDYITKPFDVREVVARVKAVIRRVDEIKLRINVDETKGFIFINDFVKINKRARIVFKNNEEVSLKPREYDLLIMLCENKNIVFSREQLLDKVWGIDFEGDLRTVDVHVQRLRKKLDVKGTQSIIETVFGVGYRMRCTK